MRDPQPTRRTAGLCGAGMALFLAGSAASDAACTPQQIQTAKDVAHVVFSVADVVCMLANQHMTDAGALSVCGIEERLSRGFEGGAAAQVRAGAASVLANARTASAQAVAGARMAGALPSMCPPSDGGR